MKTILCFGDSNTFAVDPNSVNFKRYSIDKTWPQILRHLISQSVNIIQEGLSGRTFGFEKTCAHTKLLNGKEYYHPCILSHEPNIIIIMLGTNDVKLSSYNLKYIHNCIEWYITKTFEILPNALIYFIQPPKIIESQAGSEFIDGNERLQKIFNIFNKLKIKNVELINCNLLYSSNIDGLHLEEDAHSHLAKIIYQKISLFI